MEHQLKRLETELEMLSDEAEELLRIFKNTSNEQEEMQADLLVVEFLEKIAEKDFQSLKHA